MDDRSAWTPGDMPEPTQPPAPTWGAPSAPGAGSPYPDPSGSSYPAAGSYPGSSGYPVPSDHPGVPGPSPASPGYPGAPGSYPASSGYPASSYPDAASPYGPPADQGTYRAASPGTYPPPASYGQVPYGATTPGGYPSGPYGTTNQGYTPGPYGAGYPPSGAYGTYAYDAGRTEGMATAAMIVGIASFLAPVVAPIVAIVLGAVALKRIKATGMQGRGQARAGVILGTAWLVLPIIAAIAVPVFLNQRHQALHDECANGNMSACDTLYNTTHQGSADHAFGDTCGGRTQGGYECTSVGAVSYGDNSHLDGLWDACAAGNGASCDQLYSAAAPGSDYSRYGMTCGGRTDGSAQCVDALGDQPST